MGEKALRRRSSVTVVRNIQLLISGVKGKKRKMALERQMQFAATLTDVKLAAMMAKHDVSRSGNLTKAELAALMQELAGAGDLPTEEEVQFVLHAADAKHDNNGAIDPDELAEAVKIWKNYLDNKPEIDVVFERYDLNRSGKLEADQLKRFLGELNDGIEPLDAEIQWVMLEADGNAHGYLQKGKGQHTKVETEKDGGISREELTRAISVWYTYQEMSAEERFHAITEAVEGGKSACCVLM